VTSGKPEPKQTEPGRELNRAAGEYWDAVKGRIKICLACMEPPSSSKHTCGLASLQAMLRI
jgi:hypothetical protein